MGWISAPQDGGSRCDGVALCGDLVTLRTIAASAPQRAPRSPLQLESSATAAWVQRFSKCQRGVAN